MCAVLEGFAGEKPERKKLSGESKRNMRIQEKR